MFNIGCPSNSVTGKLPFVNHNSPISPLGTSFNVLGSIIIPLPPIKSVPQLPFDDVNGSSNMHVPSSSLNPYPVLKRQCAPCVIKNLLILFTCSIVSCPPPYINSSKKDKSILAYLGSSTNLTQKDGKAITQLGLHFNIVSIINS